MRRWEDWERSRLRKIKREEKRRREMERAYPRGFPTDPTNPGSFLRPHTQMSDDGHWESDTVSVVSSNDDDQWGTQIGAYNENASLFPPPPQALHRASLFEAAPTLGKDEMEAMLEQGFDDETTPPVPPLPMTQAPRYQLTDSPAGGRSFQAYAQVGRPSAASPPRHVTSPTSPLVTPNGTSSAIGGDFKTHVKKRSGSKTQHDIDAAGRFGSGTSYGPLGPLDPASPPRRI